MSSVAYDNWDPDFQDVWENTPGTSDLYGYQLHRAEEAFEDGFMHHRGEQPFSVTQSAREEFFDIIGYDEEFFDWDGWREAMGYD